MLQGATVSSRVQDAVDRFVRVILSDLRENRLKLPTLPEVATRVQRAVDDPNSSTAQIAKMISTDAALSARLIQVANSPLYRGRTYIDSVQNAVTRLGTKTVRDLVTILIMKQLFQTKSPLVKRRMQTLWLHSTEVAALASLLARRFTSLSVDQALLGGLLHDVGAMPLIARAEEVPELAGNETALEQVIRQLHTEIGKQILETWEFPAELVACAAEHEVLGRYSAEVDYVDIVVVANLHAHRDHPHRLADTDWGDVPAFSKLGLTPDESLEVMEQIRGEVAELKQMLGG